MTTTTITWEDIRRIKPDANEGAMCYTYDPTSVGLVCTRTLDHAGPHIAHIDDVPEFAWNDGDTEMFDFGGHADGTCTCHFRCLS